MQRANIFRGGAVPFYCRAWLRGVFVGWMAGWLDRWAGGWLEGWVDTDDSYQLCWCWSGPVNRKLVPCAHGVSCGYWARRKAIAGDVGTFSRLVRVSALLSVARGRPVCCIAVLFVMKIGLVVSPKLSFCWTESIGQSSRVFCSKRVLVCDSLLYISISSCFPPITYTLYIVRTTFQL